MDITLENNSYQKVVGCPVRVLLYGDLQNVQSGAGDIIWSGADSGIG